MFSGIIQSVGNITDIAENYLEINSREISAQLEVSDSVCVSGACLTVIEKSASNFKVNVVPETVKRTNFKRLSKNSKVNLEPTLKLGDKVGGHIVQGHVDCTASIMSILPEGNSMVLKFQKPESISKYIVEKGFIAVDGASLTVTENTDDSFSVAIIPYTWDNTSFSDSRKNSTVNLEVDMTAKYIENFLLSYKKL